MMPFAEKLSFLMHITETSNKELAAVLSVDPSMISLMRTGKRRLSKNPVQAQRMAAYFAQRCSAPYQRQALSEMLGLSSISPTLPVDSLADYLKRWLMGHENLADVLLDGIQSLPKQLVDNSVPSSFPISTAASENETLFFFGEEGRRAAIIHMAEDLLRIETPCAILFVVDDNLEWLLSDYPLAKKIQAGLMELSERGFTFLQIMPPMNFINRYAESLRFWLPLYATGQTKVYYYPRLRGNLYRHSIIVVPGHCAQFVASVGPGSASDITMFTTNTNLVAAFEDQFQDHLSLCRPSLTVHRGPEKLFPLLNDFFSRSCDTIQMSNTLPAITMPKELLVSCVEKTELSVWKQCFQTCIDNLPKFEAFLCRKKHIDMARLATAAEVRSGKVCIASPHETHLLHPRYTPQTYILHLQNILRLMDEYENYFFLPLHGEEVPDYDLYVNEDDMALITRTAPPLITLEIRRQAMVTAVQEHLLRKADSIGYDGIHKEKARMELRALIQELNSTP